MKRNNFIYIAALTTIVVGVVWKFQGDVGRSTSLAPPPTHVVEENDQIRDTTVTTKQKEIGKENDIHPNSTDEHELQQYSRLDSFMGAWRSISPMRFVDP